jgi:hypothetical protein
MTTGSGVLRRESPRWIDHNIGRRRSRHLGLIPGVAALLVGEAVDDLSDAPCRWSVDDRTDDGGRNYSCGRDSRGGCDRMVTAAATVVASAVVTPVVAVVNIDVYISIYVDILVYVYVSVYVGVLIVVSVDAAVCAAAHVAIAIVTSSTTSLRRKVAAEVQKGNNKSEE